MAKKKREEGHGGHGWFVTFADLMALLLAFFVMLVAFSNQDQQKLKIVAGSMREAFGVQTEARYSGVIESDGIADPPEAEEHRAYPAGGGLQHADPGREAAQPGRRRETEDRPRIRARLGLVAAGTAGHAGTDRNLETHHVRGDQPGPQPRNRRPGWPLDVRRRLQGAVRSDTAADRRNSRRR